MLRKHYFILVAFPTPSYTLLLDSIKKLLVQATAEAVTVSKKLTSMLRVTHLWQVTNELTNPFGQPMIHTGLGGINLKNDINNKYVTIISIFTSDSPSCSVFRPVTRFITLLALDAVAVCTDEQGKGEIR